MKSKKCIQKLRALVVFCLMLLPAMAIGQTTTKSKNSKTVFIPKNVSRVPVDNDFTNNQSVFSNTRKVEGDNIVIFWSKEFGDDPMKNLDTAKRFDVNRMLTETERFYNYYINKLKVLKKGKSVSDKHKAMLLVYGGDEATAYGWGKDSVAILWTPAVRIHQYPYGVLAHELGHSFQYMAGVDAGISFSGAINEMGAQYLLWQVHPDWTNFEYFHIKAFLKHTNLAFLHPENQYHSPFLIEYWADKHGKHFYGKLLGNVNKGEDPVQTYKRITNIDQAKFNDEVFEASRKFITWDFDRVRDITSKYANKYKTTFDKAKDGWYQVSKKDCPQDYGFNAIQLKLATALNTVKLEFKGIAGADGFVKANVGHAGWRYGFLAVKENGKRVYGKIYANASGQVEFKVPAKTTHLWLVVTGAPTAHKQLGRRQNEYAQWPYQIKLTGADLY